MLEVWETKMKFDIEKVADVIREVSATEVMPRWRKLSAEDISEKTGADDLVTVADQASETALAKALMAMVPGTELVGEESVFAQPERMELFKTDKPLWVIDPIDGTMGFSQGSEDFDMMIALVQKGELLAAWIYAPASDDLYMGERDGGVARVFKGARQSLLRKYNGNTDIAKLTGIMGKKSFTNTQRAHILSFKQRFAGMIGTISAGHDYTALLRDKAQFAIYNKCSPWDHLPGLMLTSELGFHYSKFDGAAYMPGDTQGGLIVASSAAALGVIQHMLFG